MNKILELREKRAKAWDEAKNFLDSKCKEGKFISDEDNLTYEKMEKEVVDLGKEIDILERREALDAELSKTINMPIKEHPFLEKIKSKTGRASNEYKDAFWKSMRNKSSFEIKNALEEGTDSEGFSVNHDEILASLRAYKEERHGSTRWANMASFSDATVLFKFRKIPDLEITTKMVIVCSSGRYNVISVENVKGKNMYVEVYSKEIKPSG